MCPIHINDAFDITNTIAYRHRRFKIVKHRHSNFFTSHGFGRTGLNDYVFQAFRIQPKYVPVYIDDAFSITNTIIYINWRFKIVKHRKSEFFTSNGSGRTGLNNYVFQAFCIQPKYVPFILMMHLIPQIRLRTETYDLKL